MSDSNEYVLKGPEFKYEESRGVGEVLYEALETYSDSICQVDAVSGKEETFANVQKRSIQLALSMQELGIKPGDHVSICSFNNMDTGVTYVAASYINAVLSFLDPSLSLKTTAHLLNIVKPKAIFCDVHAVQLIENALKEINLNSILIIYDVKMTEHTNFAALVKNRNEESAFRPTKINNIKDLHAVIFSSGSTGDPKGIKVPHCMPLHGTARHHVTKLEFDCVLHFSTFYWITGVFLFLMGLLKGYKRIVVPRFDSKTALKTLQDYKVGFALVPTFFVSIFENEFNDSYDFTNLKCLSGTSISEDQMLAARKMFPHTCILHSWGMTECAVITHLDNKTEKHLIDEKLTTNGKLVPGLSARVVDLNTNQPVGPGVIGEWRLKCDYFTTGYYNQDSTDLWDEKGYLKTGDLGYYDEDECVYLVDRIKHLIKYAGYHIFPKHIEELLLKHPSVEQAIIFGIPKEDAQDHCAGFVVLKENSDAVTAQDIINFVHAHVSENDKIRGGLKIVKQIPKTPTGKIPRHHLIEMYINNTLE